MSTVTFDEIERNADRTFAYALLARVATNYVLCAYRLYEVEKALRDLLRVITPDKLQTLTPEQTEWLTKRLQEVHALLADFSRSSEIAAIARLRLPIVCGLADKVKDATEDLGDAIEDLVLLGSPDFKTLVSDCASSIGLSSGDAIAGLRSKR